MPTIADLRDGRRRTVLLVYQSGSTDNGRWMFPTAPTAAGTGAGYNPTQYLSDVPALSADAYLTEHLFYADGKRPAGRLLDLLWVGPSIALNTLATTTLGSGTLPARDANGASDGHGVELGWLQVTSTGSGTWVVSASYTNQAGTSGRTATIGSGNEAASIFGNMALQEGDGGVRSVESVTVSDATGVAATAIPILYRKLSTRREVLYVRSGAAVGGDRRPSGLGDSLLLQAGTVLMPVFHYFGNVSAVSATHKLTLTEV